MDGWTLGLLIDYIYTAEIQVTEENVQVNACARTFIFSFVQYLKDCVLLSHWSDSHCIKNVTLASANTDVHVFAFCLITLQGAIIRWDFLLLLLDENSFRFSVVNHNFSNYFGVGFNYCYNGIQLCSFSAVRLFHSHAHA